MRGTSSTTASDFWAAGRVPRAPLSSPSLPVTPWSDVCRTRAGCGPGCSRWAVGNASTAIGRGPERADRRSRPEQQGISAKRWPSSTPLMTMWPLMGTLSPRSPPPATAGSGQHSTLSRALTGRYSTWSTAMRSAWPNCQPCSGYRQRTRRTCWQRRGRSWSRRRQPQTRPPPRTMLGQPPATGRMPSTRHRPGRQPAPPTAWPPFRWRPFRRQCGAGQREW
jgi:hypothetical protein